MSSVHVLNLFADKDMPSYFYPILYLWECIWVRYARCCANSCHLYQLILLKVLCDILWVDPLCQVLEWSVPCLKVILLPLGSKGAWTSCLMPSFMTTLHKDSFKERILWDTCATTRLGWGGLDRLIWIVLVRGNLPTGQQRE